MTLAGSAPSTDGHLDLHREGYVGSNVGTSHPESYENKTRHRNLNNAALPSRNQGFLYGVRPTPRRKAQAQFHTDFYTPQHLPFHASRHHGGGGFNSLRGLVKPSVEKVPGLKLEKQNGTSRNPGYHIKVVKEASPHPMFIASELPQRHHQPSED